MSSVPSVLRPLTCHSPVRPGGTLKRGSNSSGNISASQLRQGRGPTRVMSPRRTLSSWGSSSRLVLRRNTPRAGDPAVVVQLGAAVLDGVLAAQLARDQLPQLPVVAAAEH